MLGVSGNLHSRNHGRNRHDACPRAASHPVGKQAWNRQPPEALMGGCTRGPSLDSSQKVFSREVPKAEA